MIEESLNHSKPSRAKNCNIKIQKELKFIRIKSTLKNTKAKSAPFKKSKI